MNEYFNDFDDKFHLEAVLTLRDMFSSFFTNASDDTESNHIKSQIDKIFTKAKDLCFAYEHEKNCFDAKDLLVIFSEFSASYRLVIFELSSSLISSYLLNRKEIFLNTATALFHFSLKQGFPLTEQHTHNIRNFALNMLTKENLLGGVEIIANFLAFTEVFSQDEQLYLFNYIVEFWRLSAADKSKQVSRVITDLVRNKPQFDCLTQVLQYLDESIAAMEHDQSVEINTIQKYLNLLVDFLSIGAGTENIISCLFNWNFYTFKNDSASYLLREVLACTLAANLNRHHAQLKQLMPEQLSDLLLSLISLALSRHKSGYSIFSKETNNCLKQIISLTCKENLVGQAQVAELIKSLEFKNNNINCALMSKLIKKYMLSLTKPHWNKSDMDLFNAIELSVKNTNLTFLNKFYDGKLSKLKACLFFLYGKKYKESGMFTDVYLQQRAGLLIEMRTGIWMHFNKSDTFRIKLEFDKVNYLINKELCLNINFASEVTVFLKRLMEFEITDELLEKLFRVDIDQNTLDSMLFNIFLELIEFVKM